MAKATKKIQNIENGTARPDDDAVIAAAFDDANNHGDDDADANIDHLPDEADDGHGHDGGDDDGHDDGREEGDGIETPPDDDRLAISEDVQKKARRSGSRLKYQIGFCYWGDSNHKTDWILNKTPITGLRFVAVWDMATSNRELFFNGKPLETHTDFWLDCLDNNGIPPRPPTFENKSEWENFPGTDNKMDPWSISYTLALVDESGSILLFQANKATTKQAFGALMAQFEGRRPIVELAKTANNQPYFKRVGWAKRIDDFSFLKEVLIVHDEPYKRPTIFGDAED
jgi:hypothetical protein